MFDRGAAKAFQILAFLATLIFVSDIALGANDPYPSLGQFVNALSNELIWPAGSTTEEKILALRAEKVIPSYLTSSHPATPTIVMAITAGVLRRARTNGDDPSVALGALIRAAVTSGAPMPAFPPDVISSLEKAHTTPQVQSEMDVPPLYRPYAYYPFSPASVVVLGQGFRGHRPHHKQTLKQIRDFPHTIFRRGESPAEKGPGVFPRH